jgi:hypothetical protein
MNIITSIPVFILAHWADLLALGAATTAINQGAQWLASKWPAFSRTSNVINTIAIDYAKLLAELAGALNFGPRAKKPPNGTGGVCVSIVFLVVVLAGCSSFLHFSNPATQAVTCAILEPEELIIESAAGICGPFAPACLSALQALFGDACTSAAAAGKSQDEAHTAGLAAVNAHASAMKLQLEKAGVKAP